MSDAREGRAETRGSTTSRVRRGLQSMSRAFSLPKVSRARDQTDLAKERRQGKAKKVKDKKKKQQEQRNSAPPLTEKLRAILGEKNLSLVLGEDFNSTQSLSLADTKEVLSKLAANITDEEKGTQIKNLLSEPQGDGQGDSYVAAKDLISEELSASKFRVLYQKAIEEQLGGNDAWLDIKLIRALKANVNVYNGIDRSLEEAFQHDNLPVLSLTPADLLAYNEVDGSLLKGIRESLQYATIIIKPFGDYTKTDTVLLSKAEKYQMFGLDMTGQALDSQTQSDESKALMKVLTEMASTDHVVFLGQSLKTTDPLTYVFRNQHGETVKAAEEGKEVPTRHVALVNDIDGQDKRLSTEECGVEYVSYKKDSYNDQITEFMSFMTGERTSIPEVVETNDIYQVAADDNAFPVFLQALSEKEAGARTINILSSTLIDVPFVENSKLIDKVRTKLTKLRDEEYAGRVIDGLEARRQAFNAKILPPVVKEEEPEEGDEVEAEEKKEETEEKKDETTQTAAVDTNVQTVVRVVYPLSAVEKFTSTAKEKEIEIVSKIPDAIKESEGRLEIRFVDDSAMQDKLANKFQLLFLKGESAAVGDLCLYQTVYTENFPVSFFEVNSNSCEEKTLFFERLWTAGGNSEDSADYLRGVVETATNNLAVRNSKPKKKGFFNRTKKKEAVEAQADTEMTNNSKTKRANFVQRMVRTVSSSVTRKPSKTQIAAPALEEVKVAAAAEEAEKKEEEVKEEVKEEEKVVEKEETKGAVEETEGKQEEKEEVKEETKEEVKEEVKEEAKEEVSEEKKKKKFAIFRKKSKKKEEPKKEEIKEEETKEEETKEVEEDTKKEETKVEETKEEDKKEDVNETEEKKEEVKEAKEEEKPEEKKKKGFRLFQSKKEKKVKSKKEEEVKETKEGAVEEEKAAE